MVNLPSPASYLMKHENHTLEQEFPQPKGFSTGE